MIRCGGGVCCLAVKDCVEVTGRHFGIAVRSGAGFRIIRFNNNGHLVFFFSPSCCLLRSVLDQVLPAIDVGYSSGQQTK